MSATPPVYRGSELHRLDGKGRFAVPSAWRRNVEERESESWVVLRSTIQNHPVLKFYPPEAFEAELRQIENDERFPRAQRKAYVYSLAASSLELSRNSQGKVLIPKALLTEYNLQNGDPIRLNGSHHHFVAMNEEVHQALSSQLLENTADLRAEYDL